MNLYFGIDIKLPRSEKAPKNQMRHAARGEHQPQTMQILLEVDVAELVSGNQSHRQNMGIKPHLSRR
jgi:hypothetical protein